MKNKNSSQNSSLQIVKLQIKKYLPFYFFVLITFNLTLIFVTIFANKNLGRILSICLTIITFFIFITYIVIFDFGAASKLRKNHFIIKGIKNKQQGQKYYQILRQVGLIRLLMNVVLVINCMIYGIFSFL